MGLFGYISSMPELNGYNIGCMAQEDENIYRKCSLLLIQNTPFVGKLRPREGRGQDQNCRNLLLAELNLSLDSGLPNLTDPSETDWCHFRGSLKSSATIHTPLHLNAKRNSARAKR